MKKTKMILCASIIIFGLTGCIHIGSTSKSNTHKNVVYDCSTISDVGQKELTKRYKMCESKLNEDDVVDCKEQANSSVCKPLVN